MKTLLKVMLAIGAVFATTFLVVRALGLPAIYAALGLYGTIWIAAFVYRRRLRRAR